MFSRTLVRHRRTPTDPVQGAIILPPTDLALVNFDGFIRTTDVLRATLQELEHGFPAEHTLVSDGMLTDVMFVFDLVGIVAAQDVIRYLHNFHECEITQLEPRAVSDGLRPTTPDPSNTLPTSPSKFSLRFWSVVHVISRPQMLYCTYSE
jgi:hypothetical protein